MDTLITSGIQISVSTNYRSDLSDIATSHYFFNYSILIENTNDFEVQLLVRDWSIFDSLNEVQYVNGLGVIGEQPILKPSEKFKYTSGCEIFSDIGLMKGVYTFKNMHDTTLFHVYVPKFKLEYPGKLN
jgi:ApaG protein